MQQHVIFNVLKEYCTCISKEEEQHVWNILRNESETESVHCLQDFGRLFQCVTVYGKKEYLYMSFEVNMCLKVCCHVGEISCQAKSVHTINSFHTFIPIDTKHVHFTCPYMSFHLKRRTISKRIWSFWHDSVDAMHRTMKMFFFLMTSRD